VSKRVTAAEVQRLRGAVGSATATPPVALPRDELAAAARTICALLAARFPGGSVELRVPPFAAVQLGIGERGRHTRGTPPNVVQTDAATLLRLACGDLGWERARELRLVQASGIYAELDQLWPLPELAPEL
jgi:hypothetical protein